MAASSSASSRPWRIKATGPKKAPTPLQALRREALFEVYVAQELLAAHEGGGSTGGGGGGGGGGSSDQPPPSPSPQQLQPRLPPLELLPSAAAVAAAAESVGRARMLATNRVDDCSVEALAASLASARAAIGACGLSTAFEAKLKREAPSKYDLIDQLLPGLWVGGWSALNNDAAALKAKKVTHVLSVISADTQRSLPPFITGRLLVSSADADDADLLSHFPAICAFIGGARAAAGGCVYVHCGAGISRAPTCCAAYIMFSGRLPSRAALGLVKRHRPCTRPNPGFVAQLRAWGKSLGLEDGEDMEKEGDNEEESEARGSANANEPAGAAAAAAAAATAAAATAAAAAGTAVHFSGLTS